MWCAHEYDAFDAVEYATNMNLRIVPRAEDRHFADEAAQAVGNEDERARCRIAASPVRRQIVQEIRSVVEQPIRSHNSLSNHVRVVAVCEYAGFIEPRREKGLRPGPRLPGGSPRGLAVTGQAMNEADVDRGVRAVVENFHAVRKRGVGKAIGRAGVGIGG